VAKLNEYLTIGEAADLLGVSKDTLRRWDRAGKLKARRHPITDYRLYLRQELAAWLKRLKSGARRRQGTAKKPKFVQRSRA